MGLLTRLRHLTPFQTPERALRVQIVNRTPASCVIIYTPGPHNQCYSGAYKGYLLSLRNALPYAGSQIIRLLDTVPAPYRTQRRPLPVKLHFNKPTRCIYIDVSLPGNLCFSRRTCEWGPPRLVCEGRREELRAPELGCNGAARAPFSKGIGQVCP